MANQIDYELNISFSEKYSIATDAYEDVPVTSLPFSVRVTNRFMGNGIRTVKALLESSPQRLMGLKGFGRNCLDEVEAFCKSIGNGSATPGGTSKKSSPKRITRFNQYAEMMASGDFSFSSELELTEEEQEYLDGYKVAYEQLGTDLASACLTETDKIIPIIQMFTEYRDSMKRYHEVMSLVRAMPIQRRSKKAMGYIRAFTLKDAERETLSALCRTEDTTLNGMASTADLDNDAVYLLLVRFLKWCSFDLTTEIAELFEKLYANERNREIIQRRAQKHTLDQIGTDIGVTRERVRQIEVKVKRVFSRYHSRIRIISKISAERDGDQVLTPSEIAEYCGENAQELMFLLQSYESANFTYDKSLDVFVLGDDSIHDRVLRYIETLPDIIKLEQLPEILSTAKDDEDIPEEMLEKAFLDAYRITGNLYHRYRLSLAAIYEKILEKHYPNGLRIYDTNEIAQFRAYVAAEYGEVGMPENDRALAARIASICILCGRGVYRLKQKKYISKELADSIRNYIIESNNPIFMTNTLFSVFEEELLKFGVDNKYYLQGILHELFAEEFTFRRDYVSKDANITTVYSAVVEFIKKAQYPIAKTLIQKEFPGITEIVINFAVSDTEVLNYFGEYLHASKLKFIDGEKDYLYRMLCNLLSDSLPHHSKDVYEIINREQPAILTRNAALYQYSAFSILEYLFKDKFQFSRPYIALNGVDIGRPAERLHDLIYSADEFEIADISEFARENRFQIQSILEYVNACNDDYLIIDSTKMMRIKLIGITENIAAQIEALVLNNIETTTPIQQLSIWNQLPKLNVTWTDWLLYSILRKWGKNIVVSTSSNQFRMAVPLVAPMGCMNEAAYADMVPDKSIGSIKIDNLDDIDLLLEDILDDDIFEEDI